VTITKVLETWSTKGLRYQIELAEQLPDTGNNYYTVTDYTHGRVTGCAVVNTLEDAKMRLFIGIDYAKMDGINYQKVGA